MKVVYVETTIVSYLRNNPAASPSSLSRQKLTRRWWSFFADRCKFTTSQYVVDEASEGNEELAEERLGHLATLPRLPLSEKIDEVAADIVSRAILPPEAILDALHISCSAVNGVEYLVTWNCKHIANPIILPRVYRTLDDHGLTLPIICTPQAMLDEFDNE